MRSIARRWLDPSGRVFFSSFVSAQIKTLLPLSSRCRSYLMAKTSSSAARIIITASSSNRGRRRDRAFLRHGAGP